MMNLLKKRHMNKPLNFIAIAAFITIITYAFQGQRSLVNMMIDMSIAVLMAASLNIAAGSLGEIVLGHAGFMCIGAYTAGIYMSYLGLTSKTMNIGHYVVVLLLGGIAAGIAGLIVGIPSLRVRGDYLAIVTLGFGEIVKTIFGNLKINGNLQGQMDGLPKLLSYAISKNNAVLIASLTTVICLCIIYIFMTSHHGRAILAIREDEIAAEAAGIPVTRYKVLAFTISALFAGIGGAMFAQQTGSIIATSFNLDRSVNYLVMVVFGGLGSYTGSVLSAIFLTWLNLKLIDLNQLRMVIYAVILILIMIFKPTGLFGIKEFSLRGTIVNFKQYCISFWKWILAFPKNFVNFFKNFGSNIKKRFKDIFAHATGTRHEDTVLQTDVPNAGEINENSIATEEVLENE